MSKKSELQHLAKKYSCDKSDHGYMELYAQIVPKTTKRLLEIGLLRGESALLWLEWLSKPQNVDFIENSTDHIDLQTLNDITDHGARVFFQDVKQINVEELADTYSVIIDDGSHNNQDQIQAFMRLWPLVEPGGWYVIEDLHTHGGYIYAKKHGASTWNNRRFPMIMDWLFQQWHVLNEYGECEFGCPEQVFNQMRCCRSIVAFQKALA